MIPLTVVTPVGPHPHNTQWLPECVASVRNQKEACHEHILVNDFGGEKAFTTIETNQNWNDRYPTRIITPRNHKGPACVNLGIAAAETDWVVILNSDDCLYPDAIKILTDRIEEILAVEHKPFYLRFSVNCSDGTRSPGGQCFHKEVWEHAGRYPNTPDLDFQLTSRILERGQYKIFDVLASEPIYFHRYHAAQLSKTGEM